MNRYAQDDRSGPGGPIARVNAVGPARRLKHLEHVIDRPGRIAAAGGDAVPATWTDQLAEGGRIVAPMVMANRQQALVIVEKEAGRLKQTILETVHFVPLKSGIA